MSCGKRCKKCGQIKPRDLFKKSVLGGVRDFCLDCWELTYRRTSAVKRSQVKPSVIAYERTKYKTRLKTAEGYGWQRYKQKCIICSRSKIDMHHVHYELPIFVIWLCRKHHIELHTIANRLTKYNIKTLIPIIGK